MDDAALIKSRIPIEELVGKYCTLQKKGRNFAALCPFHNDTKPSLLVSPDKGIAYCFACQTGGDIFNFYQAIEGVDFPQAVRDLAERAGVTLERTGVKGPKKDEKDRVRDCLGAALSLYRAELKNAPKAQAYLRERGVPAEQVDRFEIGVAPDSFSHTYEHLLKAGFSKREILSAGLGVQRELQEERVYDRFRNRLMFPIHDAQGELIGFGGRTLADDDAKYINSSDGILFHKSGVLYGLHHARDAIRAAKSVIIVEGYFDVLACHNVDANNAVATCGTALTADHVKLLRRYADSVTLCLDQDRAGQEAMERAFLLLAPSGLHVDAVMLPGKDPSEILAADPTLLKRLLTTAATPYLDDVIARIGALDLSAPQRKREAVERLLPLLAALPSAVERGDYLRKAANVLQTTETALDDDLRRTTAVPVPVSSQRRGEASPLRKTRDSDFSSVEVVLGIFLCYPNLRSLLSELIPPQSGVPTEIYAALRKSAEAGTVDVNLDDASPETRTRVGVLQLYCEHHGFTDWSETLAVREIHRNCLSANREVLRDKQHEITEKLLNARKEGKVSEEAQLRNQYDQVLKLLRKAA